MIPSGDNEIQMKTKLALILAVVFGGAVYAHAGWFITTHPKNNFNPSAPVVPVVLPPVVEAPPLPPVVQAPSGPVPVPSYTSGNGPVPLASAGSSGPAPVLQPADTGPVPVTSIIRAALIVYGFPIDP